MQHSELVDHDRGVPVRADRPMRAAAKSAANCLPFVRGEAFITARIVCRILTRPSMSAAMVTTFCTYSSRSCATHCLNHSGSFSVAMIEYVWRETVLSPKSVMTGTPIHSASQVV